MRDWIAPVEAAYELEQGLEPWVQSVLEAAHPLFDDVTVFGGCVLSRLTHETKIAAGAPWTCMPRFEHLIRRGAPRALSLVFGTGRPLVASLSEQVFAEFPETERLFTEASGAADCLYLVAPAADGSLMALAAGLPARRSATPAERRDWTRIAAHIGAGLRRGAIQSHAALGRPEAVLDPAAMLLDLAALRLGGPRRRAADTRSS